MCWVPNLVVAEWLILRRDAAGARALQPTSPLSAFAARGQEARTAEQTGSDLRLGRRNRATPDGHVRETTHHARTHNRPARRSRPAIRDTQGAGTQVLTHLHWFIVATGKPGEGARGIMMGAGWVINILVAEWIIRRRPPQLSVARAEADRGGRALVDT